MSDRPAEGSEGFVFRDRRRIDPETGEMRTAEQADATGATTEGSAQPAPPGGAAGAAGAADAAEAAFGNEEAETLRTELAERTLDLKRVQAEYVNYRRRVDRDREGLHGQAVAEVLRNLLPVLDDVDRAREHGQLEGGFKAVADALDQFTTKLGLERYGADGDPFDPTVHEAMTHDYSPDVEGIVASRVYQPGYRVGTKVLRVARVAVTEAEGGATPASVEGALKLDDVQDPTTNQAGADPQGA